MRHLKYFRFWCQKVMPLVYDDSLSYYEVLCKVVDYLNSLIHDTNSIIDNINELQAELEEVQKWIDNFDTSFIADIVDDYIATMIFVEINDNGYITYFMPEKWEDITFNTTGLDIQVPPYGYGHLVLSY